MTLYNRKTCTTTPEGRQVLVATVRNPIATESAVFPMGTDGRVASAMHLFRVKHGPGDDLDAKHDALVAAVEAGTITLEDREATQEETEEAWGDLLLLRKILDKRGVDGETPQA